MAYAPLTKIPQQFFDNLGNPLVSGTLYAYLAGTSTPTNMFSDNSGTVAGTSVVLDSRGEPTTFKLIWLNTAVIYKFVLKDSTGTTIWTIDNISGDDGTGNTASSVFDQQTLTATAGQTLFNLGYEYVTGTNAMAVYKNGSRLITGTDFTETSSTSVTLTMAAIAGDEYTFIGGQDVSSSFSSSNVSFIQSGTGAVTRSVQTKLRETVSVKDFGAAGDGTTDDTAAFTAARTASSGRYYIPDGTYFVASSPDVWTDNFTASGAAFIKIGATTYNVSNAFAGRLRYQVASNVLTNIVDAVTGNIIVGYQNSAAGTATYFYRGLAFKTDSHWCQVKPATNGGSTDLLWQRSDVNADPNGNRFNFTFEESIDRLLFSYATSASGAPNFDTFLSVVAGASPSMAFPGLAPMFNQGWKMQTRAGGALKLSYAPTSATVATLQDDTSSNVLQTTTRSRQNLAGVGFDTLLDTPTGLSGPQQWGGVFGDLVSGGALPITKNLWSNAGATRNYVAGRMIIAAQSSGAGGSARIARFVFDGTTVTITDETNTLPVQVTATIALVSTNLQFQASYSGGLGAGCTISVFIEWSGAGR